jgi:hydroxymethylpyrimidine/phosphomethylpyrimidine kinase
MSNVESPRLLIVAGHDSSRGAGIDADLASLSGLPIVPLVVVTAFTIQDERGVHAVNTRDPMEWGSEALELASAGVSAVKFGLLPGAEHVLQAAELVRSLRRITRSFLTLSDDPPSRPVASRMDDRSARAGSSFDEVRTSRAGSPPVEDQISRPGSSFADDDVVPTSSSLIDLRIPTELPIVVDPVIASSSGTRFLDASALDALRERLIAAGVVLTPNLAEAAELASMPLELLIRAPERRLDAAERLLALGARAVIIKGGHGDEDPARDLIAVQRGGARWHMHERIRGGKIRGSGCRYATRLAAGLALGSSLEASARDAGNYVARSIREQARPASSA